MSDKLTFNCWKQPFILMQCNHSKWE